MDVYVLKSISAFLHLAAIVLTDVRQTEVFGFDRVTPALNQNIIVLVFMLF